MKSLIKLEREDPKNKGKTKYNYIKIREDEKLKTQSQNFKKGPNDMEIQPRTKIKQKVQPKRRGTSMNLDLTKLEEG